MTLFLWLIGIGFYWCVAAAFCLLTAKLGSKEELSNGEFLVAIIFGGFIMPAVFFLIIMRGVIRATAKRTNR